MSRIGNQPVKIEKDVKVEVTNEKVKVIGPLGELERTLPETVSARVDGDNIIVERKSETKQAKSDHGTIRAIIANMVEGVARGYKKELELVGMGYRATMEGDKLSMKVGWTHPIVVEPPTGVKIEVPDETHINISGVDKQAVGQIAAKIRAARKPEPYKGKGVRYVDEVVRRKTSKTSKEEAE